MNTYDECIFLDCGDKSCGKGKWFGIGSLNWDEGCRCGDSIPVTAEILAKLLRENGWTCEAPDDTR